MGEFFFYRYKFIDNDNNMNSKRASRKSNGRDSIVEETKSLLGDATATATTTPIAHIVKQNGEIKNGDKSENEAK